MHWETDVTVGPQRELSAKRTDLSDCGAGEDS